PRMLKISAVRLYIVAAALGGLCLTLAPCFAQQAPVPSTPDNSSPAKPQGQPTTSQTASAQANPAQSSAPQTGSTQSADDQKPQETLKVNEIGRASCRERV